MGRGDEPSTKLTAEEAAVLRARQRDRGLQDYLGDLVEVNLRVGERLHDRAPRSELLASVVLRAAPGGGSLRGRRLRWGLLRSRPHARSIGAFARGRLGAGVTCDTRGDCSSQR